MIRHVERDHEPTPFMAFLSVIMCTIGLLMLVLVGVAVTSFWGAEQVIVEVPSVDGGSASPGRIYVECADDGLVVHPEEIVVSLEDLEDPARWINGPYGRCLIELRRRGDGGSVHFLVRRGGLAVFRKALGYAFAAGGGTTDAVARGEAVFSIGRQLVLMPGTIRVQRDTETEPDPTAAVGRNQT